MPLLSVCCVPQAVVWHSVGSMPKAAKAGQPPWQHLSGIKRITSEFKHLHRSVQNGQSNQLSNLILVNDEVTQWRFELKNFDDSVATGHQLNQDLQQLMSQHHQDFLLMELTFPQAYPQEPPFLRVVSPRCVWYTGHVTAGGAICLEVLTNTGSANGWRSDYCAESIVQIAIMNMLHCMRDDQNSIRWWTQWTPQVCHCSLLDLPAMVLCSPTTGAKLVEQTTFWG